MRADEGTQLQFFEDEAATVPQEQEYIAKRIAREVIAGVIRDRVKWCRLTWPPDILFWSSDQDKALALPLRLWQHYDARHEIEELLPVGKDWNVRHLAEHQLMEMPEGLVLDMNIIEGAPSVVPWPIEKMRKRKSKSQ